MTLRLPASPGMAFGRPFVTEPRDQSPCLWSQAAGLAGDAELQSERVVTPLLPRLMIVTAATAKYSSPGTFARTAMG